MKDILNNLTKVSGVKGALLIGRDGLVAASQFREDMDEDIIGAFTSSILSSIESALEKMNYGTLKRFVINGEKGRVVIETAGHSILIVMLDGKSNLGLALVEIKNAVAAIKAKLNV